MKDRLFYPKNRFLWLLLAFQGGYVNIGGFLSVHIFVSHVTGFAAHFANSLKAFSFEKSLYFLLVPFFFLLGSFISSLFTEIRRKKKQPPVYTHLMCGLGLIFLLTSILGNLSMLGGFGDPVEHFRDFILMSLLSFSCGVQNALFTHYSHSVIRTTHLTGLTTDLGVGLAKEFIARDEGEKPINKVRVELILFFIIGSIVGAYIFPLIEFWGFILPVIICLFVAYQLSRNTDHKN